jgi:shikimate dehydrogenase
MLRKIFMSLKFAVVGKSILHSMSPLMFNKAFVECGIDATYTRLSARDVADMVAMVKKAGFDGFNVTAPFKQSIISYLDDLDHSARLIDAVNVVVVRDGHLIGYNTDFIGVIGALEVNKIPPEKQRVLVLGAGGAGRAAVFGLQRLGMDVSLVNRSLEHALDVGMRLQTQVIQVDGIEKAVREADIIVSCLPNKVAMIDAAWLHEGQVVMDANYASSAILKKARSKGCKVIGGKDWLWAQALPSFELMVGQQAPVDVMRQALKENKKNNIALIGCMGAGKSSVAQLLSHKLNMGLVDVDSLIENKTEKTITQIFEGNGEQHFRELEKQEVAAVANLENVVIACGGGVVLDKDNMSELQKNCHIVWLHIEPKSALDRVKSETSARPLLKSDFSEEYAERKLLYMKYADMVINSEDYTVEEIVEHLAVEIDGELLGVIR